MPPPPQDDIVVFVHTDEGITGIGESDVNPWIARARIEAPSTHSMGLALRKCSSAKSARYGPPLANLRRQLHERPTGAVINAIGAIDMALWTSEAKPPTNPPQPLGGTLREAIQPYAPPAQRHRLINTRFPRRMGAKRQGNRFPRRQPEINLFGPYNHTGMHESDDKVTEVLAACRKAAGPDFTLAVDVQYARGSADRALAVVTGQIRRLFSDPLGGRPRRLRTDARRKRHPHRRREWQTARHEFADLMDVCVRTSPNRTSAASRPDRSH